MAEESMAGKVVDRARELEQEEDQLMDLEDDFVKSCLDANERGDGVLYAYVNAGKYKYNPKTKQWFIFDGNSWVPDLYKSSLEGVERCALIYEQLATNPKRNCDQFKERLLKRAYQLRTLRRAKKVLFWAPIVDQSMVCGVGGPGHE